MLMMSKVDHKYVTDSGPLVSVHRVSCSLSDPNTFLDIMRSVIALLVKNAMLDDYLITCRRWWTWRHRQVWISVQFNENLISIWNFSNTVMKNVKYFENFKSVEFWPQSSESRHWMPLRNSVDHVVSTDGYNFIHGVFCGHVHHCLITCGHPCV